MTSLPLHRRGDSPRHGLLRRTLLLAAALAFVASACQLVAEVDRDKIVETSGGGERGALGGYRPAVGQVFGWAVGADPATPVDVRIEIEGPTSLVETVTADEVRDDLMEKGIDPDGSAGFTADVGAVENGSIIRAFIVGSEIELIGSPLTVNNGVNGTGGAGGSGTGGTAGSGGTASGGSGGAGGAGGS